MRQFLKNIIIKTSLRRRDLAYMGNKTYSAFIMAKGYRDLKITVKRLAKDIVLVSIGIFSAAFGFKGFLLTNHFIDGGATGISLLISALTSIPLYQLIIAVNIPFIIFKQR